jgi:hypothetical protein
MKTELLLQLADYLDAGKFLHKEFNYKYVDNGPITENGCGTAGCALGELPGCFPDLWEYRKIYERMSPCLKGNTFSEVKNSEIIQAASFFFDIPTDFARHLFTPTHQITHLYGGSFLDDDATASQVAQHIRDSVQDRERVEKIVYEGKDIDFTPYQSNSTRIGYL